MPQPSSPAPGAGGQVQRDIVVLGASAGGVEALAGFVSHLPSELGASLFVVLHVMASGTSVLPAILTRSGPLPAYAAGDGERFERGTIYVAPPDVHMILGEENVRLIRGPRENGHRPAVDPLFRSAARQHGPRVIGVVLSGSLDDGVAGLRFVKDRGGAALVQDPGEAQYDGMPRSAIERVDVDRVGTLEQLAQEVCALIEEPVATAPSDSKTEAAERPDTGIELMDEPKPEGVPAALTCPECGGPMWEQGTGSLVRFECRVGHAFSPDSLVVEQSRALENALWAALQSMQERADLLRRVARRSPSTRVPDLEARAQAASQHAAVLRDTLSSLVGTDPPDNTEPAGEPQPVR
jgi:two-component system, chemotaxis family, protein-glutamate methylesterase/glutaminase